MGTVPEIAEMLGKIHNEDCLETMRRMPDKSVDLIVTDPPYGVGKADWDSVFPISWIPDAVRVSHRLLVMTGNSALMLAGNAFADQYRDCIVLHAVNGMTNSKIAFGNWIPTIAVGDWKWKARPNYIKFTVTTEEEIPHPSPKPIQAIVSLMNWYSEAEWTVYDPFMGSGTTAVACERLGRKWIGSEINPDYVKIAEKRIANERAQMKMEFM